MKNNDLKKRVMRRVYVIYARNFLIENGLRVTIITVLFLLVASVSVVDVLRNIPKDNLGSISIFLVSAFANTEAAVKALFGVLALSSFFPIAKLGFKTTRKLYFRPSVLQA